MTSTRAFFSIILLLFTTSFGVFAQNFSSQVLEKKIATHESIETQQFIHDPEIYNECWDTLAQARFWKQVIVLTQDSVILNVASSRQILGKIPTRDWYKQTEIQKTSFKDSLRRVYNVSSEASIYVTAGKREFYSTFKKVVPSIGRAIKVFNEQGTDPWYAQTILLIESPGKMQKSSVGAYGPFQLMKSVAIKQGLKVNKYVDEREDFDKSAMGAARLLGRTCVPEVKKILDVRCIPYKETDLWFRLLVLHAYHAGSGNVNAVISKISPSEGGMGLITQMWQTEAGGFKNASQNYSQIAIASLVRFDDIVYYQKDTVYLVEGDKLFRKYQSFKSIPRDSLHYLTSCMKGYECDLLDGTVPVEYFISKIKVVEREVITVCTKDGCKKEVIEHTLNTFKYSEQQFSEIGQRLLKQRRYNDALEIFKVNAQYYPNSLQANTDLAEAYRLLGNKQLALHYSKKAAGQSM